MWWTGTNRGRGRVESTGKGEEEGGRAEYPLKPRSGSPLKRGALARRCAVVPARFMLRRGDAETASQTRKGKEKGNTHDAGEEIIAGQAKRADGYCRFS